MVVGTLRITLSLPGNNSLKGKRKIIRRVLDKAKHRFNASIAEVDAQDEHRRAVLGIAVVSNDARHANSMLDQLREFVEGASEAPVVDQEMEIIHVGEMYGDTIR